MDQTNKINAVIETAMKNLNDMIDVNTVVGKPIATEAGTVFPICKVTLGFMTGGGEYGEVKLFKKDSALPFAGGSGAVVSIKPAGFLVYESGKYRIEAFTEGVDKLIESTGELFRNMQEETQ